MAYVPYKKGNIYRFMYDEVMPEDKQHPIGKRVTIDDNGKRVTVVVTKSSERGYYGKVIKVQAIKKPGPSETKAS